MLSHELDPSLSPEQTRCSSRHLFGPPHFFASFKRKLSLLRTSVQCGPVRRSVRALSQTPSSVASTDLSLDLPPSPSTLPYRTHLKLARNDAEGFMPPQKGESSVPAKKGESAFLQILVRVALIRGLTYGRGALPCSQTTRPTTSSRSSPSRAGSAATTLSTRSTTSSETESLRRWAFATWRLRDG